MKNIFYKKFIKGINPDMFDFLAADINQKINVHKKYRDEIYTNRGNSLEIVGMSRRLNLFRRILPTIKFNGLVNLQKNNFINQKFLYKG